MITDLDHKTGSILPKQAVPLKTLTVIMAVMCYLASLAVGALILIDRAVTDWTGSVTQEVTVQLRLVQDADLDKEAQKAMRILENFPGIAKAELLEKRAASDLLRPWLGSIALDELPLPRLIKVKLATPPPDFTALEQSLKTQVKGISLDNHKRWQSEFIRMARILSVLTFLILVLVSLCAVTVVIFASRTVLEANRHIIDLLHLIGAKDKFIAHQIEGQFLKTGLWASIIGVGAGLLSFLLLSLSKFLGNDDIAQASYGLLFAPLSLSWINYALFLSVPLVATIITLLTARLTLLRILGEYL